MAITSLPPGFRFHPTDVELVMYYLKRKNQGKKFGFEAISEVNLYKFSPWDLPGKSCLKSKDLEWFFFCPIEKKYARGDRVQRATENGYWKTTGKDRPICYKNQNVGTVRTLVFHLGHAPKGERTDWVIHEYKILDDQLSAVGCEESFVLCKLFKKNGLGPKNGAQYGAPFDEADWVDADIDDGPNHSICFLSNNTTGETLAVTEKQKSTLAGMADIVCTSVLPPTETSPSSSIAPTNEMLDDEAGDEIVRLLAAFKDDGTLPSNNTSSHQNGLTSNGQDVYLPRCGRNDFYDNINNLEHRAPINNDFSFGSGMQIDGKPLNDMLPLDNLYFFELDDILSPLNDFAGLSGTEPPSLEDIFRSPNNGSVGECNFTDLPCYASCMNQVPAHPQGGCSDSLQIANHQFYQGSNPSFGLNCVSRQLPHKGGQHFMHNRGGGGSDSLQVNQQSVFPAGIHSGHGRRCGFNGAHNATFCSCFI